MVMKPQAGILADVAVAPVHHDPELIALDDFGVNFGVQVARGESARASVAPAVVSQPRVRHLPGTAVTELDSQ